MLQDFRFAFRQLIKARTFTTAAVVVLALGIGANTAIFSLMNTLLFQPPHYAAPQEVVQLFSQDRKDPKNFRGFSYPTYLDIRQQNSVFSGLTAHNLAMVGLGENGNTRRAFTDVVSANFFSVMGVRPMLGRTFRPEEETPGRDSAVAIVSYNFWKREGLKPALLGSTIRIDARPYTVIGILPKGFTGTAQIFAPEIWLPLGVYDQVANDFETENKSKLNDRAGRQLMLVGRLKPGMTATSTAPALKNLAANLERAWPVEQKNQTFMVAPLSRFSLSTSPPAATRSSGWPRCFSGWQASSCWSRVSIWRTCSWRAARPGEKRSRSGSRSGAVAGGSCASYSWKASSSRSRAAVWGYCSGSGRLTSRRFVRQETAD